MSFLASTRPAASEARCHAEASRSGRAVGFIFALIAGGLIAVGSPLRASADDDTPSIVGYALEGFSTGIAVGFATGYLATGPKFESDEWRTLLWGGGIGALSGLGLGLVLGIVDASTVPNGPGVGFYIIRDSNYGYTVGALAGGVVGALIWAGGGVAKDVLKGLAWGTVIGAGTGIILGVIEGSLRTSNRSQAASETGLRLSLGFTPPDSDGVPLPYPTLSARF